MISTENKEFKILYEDDEIIAIDKSSGIPVIPERLNKEKLNLFSYLNSRCLTDKTSHYFVVHRIDRDCSGIVLFAKNAPAHQFLCIQFEQHKVLKEYIAIVIGIPERLQDMIDLPIYQRKKGPVRAIVRNDGKPSQSSYEVLQKFSHYSYLKLIPHTGRTNQLRVHLSSIGYPIVGDPLYNKNSKPITDSQGNIIMGRLALHARQLTFIHPVTQVTHTLSAPIPPDFQACLDFLSGRVGPGH